MTVTAIHCADDLAAMAKEVVEQFWKQKRYSDLIGAVLMANHVADWHFKNDLKRKEFGAAERTAMTVTYPEWDLLRQVANGTKHCSLQARQDLLDWKHDDFWSSPGHVGEDGLDWFVEFDGKLRSVAVLIEHFLTKFADHSTRPT